MRRVRRGQLARARIAVEGGDGVGWARGAEPAGSDGVAGADPADHLGGGEGVEGEDEREGEAAVHDGSSGALWKRADVSK